MNEDFEIMTVSFSDITDNQFAEQLKERLYNHCIRSILLTSDLIIFFYNLRMEEMHEEAKQKMEIENQKADIREIRTIVNKMEHSHDQDQKNFKTLIEEFKIKQEKDFKEMKLLLQEFASKK